MPCDLCEHMTYEKSGPAETMVCLRCGREIGRSTPENKAEEPPLIDRYRMGIVVIALLAVVGALALI